MCPAKETSPAPYRRLPVQTVGAAVGEAVAGLTSRPLDGGLGRAAEPPLGVTERPADTPAVTAVAEALTSEVRATTPDELDGLTLGGFVARGGGGLDE
jgi:hypothetical protein